MGNTYFKGAITSPGSMPSVDTTSHSSGDAVRETPSTLVALFREHPKIGAHILGFLSQKELDDFSQVSRKLNELSLVERYQRARKINVNGTQVDTCRADIIDGRRLQQAHQLPDFNFFGCTERRSFLKRKTPTITRDQIVDARDPEKPADLAYLHHYARALNFFRPERTPLFAENRVLDFVNAWMDSITPYLTGEQNELDDAQCTTAADLCAFIASQGYSSALDRIFSGRTPEVEKKLIRLLWKHSMSERVGYSAHLPLYGPTALYQDLAATAVGMPFGVTLYKFTDTLERPHGQPPFFHTRNIGFIETFLDRMKLIRKDNLTSLRSLYKYTCRLHDPKFRPHQKQFIQYLAIRCILADKADLQNPLPAAHEIWTMPDKERTPLLRAHLKRIKAPGERYNIDHERHAAYNDSPGVSVTYTRQHPATILDGIRDFVVDIQDHSK